jgi:hypothetical protein
VIQIYNAVGKAPAGFLSPLVFRISTCQLLPDGGVGRGPEGFQIIGYLDGTLIGSEQFQA